MQLRYYLAAIARRWWILALVVLSATLFSFGFTKLQPTVYRSSVLLVNTARLDWGTTMTVQVLLRQQEEQLKTVALASRVNERMQLGLSPEEIAGRIRTKSYADSLTVRLEADDQDPDRARRIALGYGRLFQEEKAAEYSQATPDNRIRVVMLEEPRAGVPVGPNTKTNTAAGAILGALVGLVLLVALEYLDDTLKTPEDVARYLNLATLGIIPSDE